MKCHFCKNNLDAQVCICASFSNIKIQYLFHPDGTMDHISFTIKNIIFSYDKLRFTGEGEIELSVQAWQRDHNGGSNRKTIYRRKLDSWDNVWNLEQTEKRLKTILTFG